MTTTTTPFRIIQSALKEWYYPGILAFPCYYCKSKDFLMVLEASDYTNIARLIQLFPSNYAEMHESQPRWPLLKEKLPQALHYINILENNKEASSLELLAHLTHGVGVFSTHVVENYPQGVQLLSQALQAKQTLELKVPESIALTHAQLADCGYRNGNYILAITHFQLAYQIYKLKEGNKNCDLERAFVLHACGNAYYIIGAYSMALALFTEAGEIRLRYLSEKDIEFGYLEHDQAEALRALGFYDEAEKLFASALEKKKSYFQTDAHTNIALLYQCRGLLYIKSNQFELAKENLKLAFAIYLQHTEHFAEDKAALLRNDFYTMLLQLAAGNLEQAEQAIDNLEVQRQGVEDKTKSIFLRISHGKIRLFHDQNKVDCSFKQLQDTLKTFIPKLQFKSAEKFLTEDNKVDIASLLSQYGIENFIQNNYQNFEECLELLSMALQFKRDFYQSIPNTPVELGAINYAFSNYDFGLFYYLAGLMGSERRKKEEWFAISSEYLDKAKAQFIQAGVNPTHANILACNLLLKKITDRKNALPDLQKRVCFFQMSSKRTLDSEFEYLPCLDTILKDYP
ncbi:MAG: hypothetical protein WC785_02035 [Tatlockia sp.]|jgi:tetratricopeptide (TPR) repeat protein